MEKLEGSVRNTVIGPRYPYQSNTQSHRKDIELAKKKFEGISHGKFYFSGPKLQYYRKSACPD